jgi:hypothetical protein
MGFSRSQLVVVSGLFWWESLDGWDFLGHNLLLSQASFSRWNSGYHEAFLMNFFHDGILAIAEPFSRTFSFFMMEFWLSRSLSHELFSRWNSGYHEAFLTNFFHDGILGMRDLGEDSFHIYFTKSIYTVSASLKTFPLDLEPPLQGKEYGPSYSNATRKSKTNFCPEITYRHVIRIF